MSCFAWKLRTQQKTEKLLSKLFDTKEPNTTFLQNLFQYKEKLTNLEGKVQTLLNNCEEKPITECDVNEIFEELKDLHVSFYKFLNSRKNPQKLSSCHLELAQENKRLDSHDIGDKVNIQILDKNWKTAETKEIHKIHKIDEIEKIDAIDVVD